MIVSADLCGSFRSSNASNETNIVPVLGRFAPIRTLKPGNCTLSRYPLTLALSSTVSGDSSRPIYSSHSMISCTTGWTTETIGGAAADGADFLSATRNQHSQHECQSSKVAG